MPALTASSAQPPRAVVNLPFGRLGITCTEAQIVHLDYLPPDAALVSPVTALGHETVRQLQAYCADAAFVFDLPLADAGTAFQRRVWDLLRRIPCGQTRSYADAATELRSAARAVGQACAANPFAPVVPCHRIVARHGLGGFAHSTSADGYLLGIKRWLLQHEAGRRHA
ncbi:MAG: methylated-DNA--[protein]-cysteine S-methyltransferase [Thiomonas sp.]